MLTLILSVILVVIIVVEFLRFAYEKPTKNYPPGPPKIPFLGSYAQLLLKDHKWPSKVCTYWGKIYNSDIISFYVGPYNAICCNSLESIKKVLTSSEYDGRLDIFPARYRCWGDRLGLFFNDGPEWKVQKRFSLRYLRDYGLGRRHLNIESITEEELKYVLEICENGPNTADEKLIMKDGGVVLFPDIVNVALVYPLLSIMTNKVWTRDTNGEMRKLIKNSGYITKSINEFGGIMAVYPFLRYLFPYLTGFEWLKRGTLPLRKFMKDVVTDILESYDANDDDDRNFVEIYSRRMNSEIEENGDSAFSVNQMVLILKDYMMAAMTSTSHSIVFLVKHLIIHPEIQEKAFDEINRVVGRGRLPNLNDRTNLPYVEACVREVLRRHTLLHFGVVHGAVKDTVLMGYDIPARTAVIPNLRHFHMDEKVWGDPESFRPERFIDEDGKLSLKNDISLPFGAGRRLCPGETYSRQVLFVTIATLIQNFVMSDPDGKLPAVADDEAAVPGIIMSAVEYWAKFTPRK